MLTKVELALLVPREWAHIFIRYFCDFSSAFFSFGPWHSPSYLYCTHCDFSGKEQSVWKQTCTQVLDFGIGTKRKKPWVSY